MNDFVFPFDSLPVPEVLAKLNEMGTAPFKITQDDVETWFSEGKIELCFNWGGLIVPSWEDMNVIWNDPATHPTYVSQIDAKPYGENVAFSPLKIPHFCEYCDSDTAHQELLFLSLHISSMVLPRAEVEKIYQMVTGLNTSRSDDRKEMPVESTKTVNYLATALKAFIHIHYGADVADNLRKNLEDPTSQIRKDFADKELKAPGGKALAGHLKDILIEISPALERVDVESMAADK